MEEAGFETAPLFRSGAALIVNVSLAQSRACLASFDHPFTGERMRLRMTRDHAGRVFTADTFGHLCILVAEQLKVSAPSPLERLNAAAKLIQEFGYDAE